MPGDAKRGEGKSSAASPSPSLVARAKEWAAVPATREAKVQFVMQKMRNLEWVRGKSAPELGEQWGMTVGSVENISAEASRRLRTEYNDPDYASASMLPRLEKTIDDALTDARSAEDGRERSLHRKVAQDGIKIGMMLTGAAAPQKVEVSTAQLSDDEVERRLAAAMAKVKALVVKGQEAEELEGEVVAETGQDGD